MDEDAFLRAIQAAPDDDAPRLVYADWLDELGDPTSTARAELLRLEVRLRLAEKGPKPPKAEKQKLQARLLQLTAGIDRDWLALLDRSPIENCAVEFAFRCPKQWESLKVTNDPQVRYCASCGKHVYHCATIAEAQEYALQGDCIAVDSRLSRTPDDLDPLPPRMMFLGRVASPTRVLARPRSLDEVAEIVRGREAIIQSGEYRGLSGIIEAVNPARRTVTIRVSDPGNEAVVELRYGQIAMMP
jgi:uncharacterized protein (TIGR02996 family)